MAFAPLPEPLLEFLARRRGVPVLDLGCGDGRFTRVLAEHGADPWGLDLAPPARGTVARVVGDARRPPLRAGHWPMVTAANLLRHLVTGRAAAALVRTWRKLLAEGGSLWILEDAPGDADAAERNFAVLQELLAALPGRGPLLGLDPVRASLASAGIPVAAAGTSRNRYPLDAVAVVAMLASGGPAPGSVAAELAASIASDGVSCGHYWWLRVDAGPGKG